MDNAKSVRRIDWCDGRLLGLLLLATACLIALGFAAGRGALQHDSGGNIVPADTAIPLKPGPWGELEMTPISIEPPSEYLNIEALEEVDRRWRFSGYTPEMLSELFRTADLTSDQRAELLDPKRWECVQDAILVSPSPELVLALSTEARKKIYTILSDARRNPEAFRVSLPTEHLDEYFAQGGVGPVARALVKKLSFPHGKRLLFCSPELVLVQLPTYDEKARFIKTLFRKKTLILRLRVSTSSNVDELDGYWARAGWGKNIKPLLESLKAVPGGTRIDILEILPPGPTARLYTYPFPSLDSTVLRQDCHWNSFNFFRETPDPRFTDPKFVSETLQKDYYPVLTAPRYGDILFFTDSTGNAFHSAVYIADNIVYTRNGAEFRQPYILMQLPDLIETYAALLPEGERINISFYRNKYY